MWKGWASRRAGLWKQAVDSMLKSIKLNPRLIFNLIETAQTLGYLGRYEEAMKLVKKAYELDPDSFWSKWYLADMQILVNSDIKRATTLMVGARQTNDEAFQISYWKTQLLAKRFEEALDVARQWSSEWEVARQVLHLREQLLAETFKAMGRDADATENANKALQRLVEMKHAGLDDYRATAARARAYSILGEQAAVAELIAEVMSSKPADAVEDLKFKYEFARNYAYAGMHEECITTLDLLLSGLSPVTVRWVELDPAFNGIRHELEFTRMLERHR